PLKAVLVPEDERPAVVTEAKQILGEIEPCPGKPPGARHLAEVHDDFIGATARDDAAEIPDGLPELGRLLDRPAIECPIIPDFRPAALAHGPQEGRHIGLLDPPRRRLPHWFRHIPWGRFSNRPVSSFEHLQGTNKERSSTDYTDFRRLFIGGGNLQSAKI